MIKILFVDDNFDCLKILERVFRKEFIVYTTSGVNAAMEILKNKKVNLVCSDWHMRGETGVVLLQEMIHKPLLCFSNILKQTLQMVMFITN